MAHQPQVRSSSCFLSLKYQFLVSCPVVLTFLRPDHKAGLDCDHLSINSLKIFLLGRKFLIVSQTERNHTKKCPWPQDTVPWLQLQHMIQLASWTLVFRTLTSGISNLGGQHPTLLSRCSHLPGWYCSLNPCQSPPCWRGSYLEDSLLVQVLKLDVICYEPVVPSLWMFQAQAEMAFERLSGTRFPAWPMRRVYKEFVYKMRNENTEH